MERNISVIKDVNGKKIVVINDICFKGRQNIDWNEVEQYLKQYVGEFVEIAESKEIIYIGNDLPDEYTGSNYTAKLKGALAKAKANIDMIPDLPFRFLMTMEKFCVIMFYVELVIRHAVDRKLYLYDIINIKKETSTPLEP